jgi:hypothetical protein
MNLTEALLCAKDGNFVTNQYFDEAQSLHYYKGKFYYEDGAVVTPKFLRNQNFATNCSWSIAIKNHEIDFEKLKVIHDSNKGYMLIDESYMDCRKKN